MMRLCVLIFSLSLSSATHAQIVKDTLWNQSDNQGRKQGYWKKTNDQGVLLYKGFFKDDKPVGEFIRYYEDSIPQSILIFDKTGSKAKVKLYYNDGNLAAEGNYINQQKDSVWKYYSYYTHLLVYSDSYKNGLKHGAETVYYENGQPFQITQWVEGKKAGQWIQYFPEGKIKAACTYENNTLHGSYHAYYSTGHPFLQGNYINGRKHGMWIYFNENGEKISEIEYRAGIPLNLDELTEKEQEFFKEIESSEGKYKDPDPSQMRPVSRQTEE